MKLNIQRYGNQWGFIYRGKLHRFADKWKAREMASFLIRANR